MRCAAEGEAGVKSDEDGGRKRATIPLVVADRTLTLRRSPNKQRLGGGRESCRDQISFLGLTAEAETQEWKKPPTWGPLLIGQKSFLLSELSVGIFLHPHPFGLDGEKKGIGSMPTIRFQCALELNCGAAKIHIVLSQEKALVERYQYLIYVVVI
jgi:hypothetical protein